jgi:hypothetical protein
MVSATRNLFFAAATAVFDVGTMISDTWTTVKADT